MLDFFELADVGRKVVESLKATLTLLLLFLWLSCYISTSFLKKERQSDLLLMIRFIVDDSSIVIGVMLASHADYIVYNGAFTIKFIVGAAWIWLL